LSKKKNWVETEFLETVILAVPKLAEKEFMASYENIDFTPDKNDAYVVPRSAELLASDTDHSIYRVIVFRKFVEEFKQRVREKKLAVVREFTFDPTKSGKQDRSKMEGEKEKQRKALIRWCKANFSEAFIGWIHLKAIRIFVESVLRYGLPTNFQLMLLAPQKGKQAKLRKVLQELYSHLSAKTVFAEEDDNEAVDVEKLGPKEKFFPYVWIGIQLPVLSKSSV